MISSRRRITESESLVAGKRPGNIATRLLPVRDSTVDKDQYIVAAEQVACVPEDLEC